MTEQPFFSYVTLSSHRADELVRFYRGLTGSPVAFAAGAYTVIGPEDPGRNARLAFQQVAPGNRVIPAHVDLSVRDLEAAADQVRALGGNVGERFEEIGSRWYQAFDPDGNVFCLMGH
jgi:predicted enzyme related to lactoylglutathione lyase